MFKRLGLVTFFYKNYYTLLNYYIQVTFIKHYLKIKFQVTFRNKIAIKIVCLLGRKSFSTKL
jgi:hypothetical protein